MNRHPDRCGDRLNASLQTASDELAPAFFTDEFAVYADEFAAGIGPDRIAVHRYALPDRMIAVGVHLLICDREFLFRIVDHEIRILAYGNLAFRPAAEYPCGICCTQGDRLFSRSFRRS